MSEESVAGAGAVCGPEVYVLVCWCGHEGWSSLGGPADLVTAAEVAFEKVGAGDPLFRANVVKFPAVLSPALIPLFIRGMLWGAGGSSIDCFYAAIIPESGQVVDASAPRGWLPPAGGAAGGDVTPD